MKCDFYLGIEYFTDFNGDDINSETKKVQQLTFCIVLYTLYDQKYQFLDLYVLMNI